MPEVDDVRGTARDTAPLSGGAAVVLLGGLGLARLLHVGGWGRTRTDEATLRAAQATELARQRGRFGAQWSRERLGQIDTSRVKARVPLSVGGVVGVAAAAYLVWRVVRGGGSPPRSDSWYMGGDRREQVPNQ
jgi:hypothetical protein